MKNVCLLLVNLFLIVISARSHIFPHREKINYSPLAITATVGSPEYGITVAGGNGQGSAANQLNAPTDVFVDSTGNIFVADHVNHRIQKWTPGAAAGITVAGGNGAGSAANQLFDPNSIFVDGAGNIYVADADNHRIQKWAPGASYGITVAGGNGPGSAANQLDTPYGVFVDAAGNIYIAELNNHRVQRWAPGASEGITVAGGNGAGPALNQLSYPISVYVDAQSNIYIASGKGIQKWAPGATEGTTIVRAVGRGSAADVVSFALDVFVDPAGNIFIADAGNDRIQKWAPGATEGITVAGGNGYGPQANQTPFPNGVFVDATGKIYVADFPNNRILKFGLPGLEVIACPGNMIIPAPSCTDKATLTWTEPRDTFPYSIDIPQELDPSKGVLNYMGALNGHGYYRSTNLYQWRAARNISKSLGGRGVNGHLLTVSSLAENNLILSHIKGTGYSPWIGLFNTGKPGRFRWVTREALTYTNWGPAEPNNAGGDANHIAEPFIRFMDTYDEWNDQADGFVPFVAEFEKPLIRYKQISGPRNGSSHQVGVYNICYERNNLITDIKDTCCFSLTVTCKEALAGANQRSTAVENAFSKKEMNMVLQVFTSPNPTRNVFRLSIVSNKTQRVTVHVSDVFGRAIESRSGINPNQPMVLGKNYTPGVYFAQVIQGKSSLVVKMIKQ